jgi:hypothetical protein
MMAMKREHNTYVRALSRKKNCVNIVYIVYILPRLRIGVK